MNTTTTTILSRVGALAAVSAVLVVAFPGAGQARLAEPTYLMPTIDVRAAARAPFDPAPVARERKAPPTFDASQVWLPRR